MKKKLAAIAVALLTSVAAPALAAPITYTLTGNFTGFVNGNPDASFNNVAAVFTGVGDTSSPANNNNGFGVPGIFAVPLSSLTAVAAGLTYNITTPSIFYVYPAALLNSGPQTRLGFGFNNDGNNALGIESTAFNGYSGLTSFPTTPGSTYFPGLGQSARFNSVGEGTTGSLTITGFTNGTFAAAVPEPATWAMMVAGFGLMGFAMRRRPKVRTTVSFA